MTETTTTAARPSRHSPCIGICRLDDQQRFCIGCARSKEEIGQWMTLSETQRDAIWAKLEDRAKSIAMPVRLLPWTPVEILQWAARSIEQRDGTWTVGVPGAGAQFPCLEGQDISVEGNDQFVVARSADGAFRLRTHAQLRAFELMRNGAIIVTMPKVRAGVTPSKTFAKLGADADAIDVAQRDAVLFDFGFGRRMARFSVRTSHEGLIESLSAAVGDDWQAALGKVAGALMGANPARVVESANARIEVSSAIMPADDFTGARTQLAPGVLAGAPDLPGGIELPSLWGAVAIFYPEGSGH